MELTFYQSGTALRFHSTKNPSFSGVFLNNEIFFSVEFMNYPELAIQASNRVNEFIIEQVNHNKMG